MLRGFLIQSDPEKGYEKAAGLWASELGFRV